MMEWFLVLALLYPNGEEQHIRYKDSSPSIIECNKRKLDKELFKTANDYARVNKAKFRLVCVGIPSSGYI